MEFDFGVRPALPSGDWIHWLLSRATESSAQVVMPQTERGVEPLAAVYRREFADTIEASLARGLSKATDALIGVPIDFVPSPAWRRIDPDRRVLTNMNTPDDYEEARRWA